MKLNLKDEPKEWRKSALLAALGLVILSSLLRWRHVLTDKTWLALLSLFGVMAVCALWQPRWFRGYHRFSMKLGFAVSRFLGRVLLVLFFFFILTPVGLILRLMGKDALQLKPRREAQSCWQTAKDYGPLDRLF
jgi:multisubunit Na+/H+ antiporter MnhG subunit